MKSVIEEFKSKWEEFSSDLLKNSKRLTEICIYDMVACSFIYDNDTFKEENDEKLSQRENKKWWTIFQHTNLQGYYGDFEKLLPERHAITIIYNLGYNGNDTLEIKAVVSYIENREFITFTTDTVIVEI